jgi:hypothetical protein
LMPGQIVEVIFQQDAVGNRTVSVSGASAIGSLTPNLAANDLTTYRFIQYKSGLAVCLKETDGAWTPANISGAYFWAKAFSDASLRSGDVLNNGISGGVSITRTAGTPNYTGPTQNGKTPIRMDATTNIGSATGGPTGNAAHCIIILTNGSDATPFTGFVRAGAVGQAGGIGLTTSGMFGAGLVVGEGVPRVDSPPEALADGTMRMVHEQHRPSYGVLTVGIDGRAPQNPASSNWSYAKVLNLDGSFAFSNIETGRTPNGSSIYDAVLVSGIVSTGDLVRLARYWTTEYALPKLAPRILFKGDSLTDPAPVAPATTTWPALSLTAVNAQLAIDGRTALSSSNIALTGKMLNRLVWAAGSPNMSRQADGLFDTWVPNGVQGVQGSAPYSRSGRRQYEIIAGIGATNDICNANRTGLEVIDDLKYVFDNYIDSEYEGIAWGTIPPGSQAAGYFQGIKETYRVQVNDWLRNDAISGGFLRPVDEVVDFEAAGLVWNVTYYGAGPDPLHQNDAGKTLMASAMTAAILRIINRVNPL